MSAANDGAHATLTDGVDQDLGWFVCTARTMRPGYRLLLNDRWYPVLAVTTEAKITTLEIELDTGEPTPVDFDAHRWLRMTDEPIPENTDG